MHTFIGLSHLSTFFCFLFSPSLSLSLSLVVKATLVGVVAAALEMLQRKPRTWGTRTRTGLCTNHALHSSCTMLCEIKRAAARVRVQILGKWRARIAALLLPLATRAVPRARSCSGSLALYCITPHHIISHPIPSLLSQLSSLVVGSW